MIVIKEYLSQSLELKPPRPSKKVLAELFQFFGEWGEKFVKNLKKQKYPAKVSTHAIKNYIALVHIEIVKKYFDAKGVEGSLPAIESAFRQILHMEDDIVLVDVMATGIDKNTYIADVSLYASSDKFLEWRDKNKKKR